MKIYKTLLFGILIFSELTSSSQRVKYNFNSNWKVLVGDPKGGEAQSFTDATWKSVTLPYAWNEDDAFKKDIADLTTGIAWYRKHFKIPATAKDQKIFLEFEGIRQAGEFYLNGKSIGIHENGVMAFGFDISDKANFGEENVIAVRIDNSWDYKEKATNTKFQWEDKNFNANYGGISKNVYLHITPKLYQTLPLYSNLQTTGVYIYADNYDITGRSATLHAESEIKNESDKPQFITYQVSVNDLNGKPVKIFTGDNMGIKPGETKIVKASSSISNLNFWSWGYGYLYDIKTSLLINGKPVDVVNTKTGFRKTEFNNGMIYLNDRVIMVHGYAQRTSNEWPAVGLSVPAWLSDYSNGLMVESNGNLVRWMHITPWKQDIESCDRVGLMQSMQAGDAEGDVTGVRWDQRKAVMRDAIIYNRNNPSIIFYECGNKGIRESNMQDMKAIRDMYDPHGGRAIGSREMLDSKVAEYGGEMLYTNKSAKIPLWAMEYSRDEGSRKYWDDYTHPYHKDGAGPLHNNQDASAYNRNMESHAVENVKRWYEFWKERPGTGKRVSAGGVNIVWSETNTHHRGEENYRRSGEVDALRIIKQNFYANQVMWDGWVNPEKQHTHIIGHWNYEAGVKKDIYVISTSEKVELKVNGRSLGYGTKSDGFLFTFKNIEWKPGNISAVGFAENNKPVSSGQINTAGAPVALRLTNIKRPTDFVADGHDLALVQVEVVDAKGNRCPTALNMINYKLDGPAEWRGGMAMGPGNYILAKSFPVEGGVNRFLIRSTTTPGTITVNASADGLRSASIVLITKPFITENGLTKVLPSAGLTGKLDRGPTPPTPSYKITRTPVVVIAATAGAHADSTFASYDDNERTEWVNDGRLSTAWIEYELARPATINEIVIKLNNFRSRSYPLKITVDGKEAFNGKTETTLGYYTIKLNPQTGSKVRIQLVGAADNKSNNEVEVNGKKLDDGVVRDDVKAKGTLSILEVEFYEALQARAGAVKPNIIFMLGDDLGYGDLGCYGQKKISTPNIDKLAKMGTRFTDFYSASAVCAPARCSFMTGLHQGHAAIRGNVTIKPEGQFPLPESETTIASLLQQNGYKTAAFGKWSLGFITTSGDPQKKGFDEFYGYNCQSLAHDYYPDHLWMNNERIELPGNLRSDSAYSADMIHQQAMNFLNLQNDTPFFLYLPYTLPHADLNVPHDAVYEKYFKKFNSVPHASFAAMVSRLDKYVGEIMQLIKKKGMEENTLIIFTSDNGPHKEGGGDPDFFNSSAGFKGIKRDLYEGGIREPFIVYKKGMTKAGSVCTLPAVLYDLYPTFLEFAGISGPSKTDGQSLIPSFQGKKQREHRYIYWELQEGGGKQALRVGDWKLVKLNVRNDKNPLLELYNLKLDPGEKKNVADSNRTIARIMNEMTYEAHVANKTWPLIPEDEKK